MSYVSSHPLGALTASELSNADNQVKAAIPSKVRDRIKVLPIPANMKTNLLEKPVSTLLNLFIGQRTFATNVINRAASLQKRYNKVWNFHGTNLGKVRVTNQMQEIQMVKLFLALSYSNPLSVLQAIIENAGKVASSLVSTAVSFASRVLGIKAGGLGAAEPVGWTVEGVLAASGAIMGAVAASLAAIAPISVALINKLFPTPTTAPVPSSTVPQPPYQPPPDYPGGGSPSEQQKAEDKGGLPAWLLPAGVGGFVGWLVLRRKR